MIQELKVLSNNCRSNSCIEHAAAIMEEEKAPEKLSKGVSALSLKGVAKKVNSHSIWLNSSLSFHNSKVLPSGEKHCVSVLTMKLQKFVKKKGE